MLRSFRWLAPVFALGMLAAFSQTVMADSAPAKDTASITGKVVNEEGKAVANAKVRLERRVEVSADQPAQQAEEGQKKKFKYEKVESTTTDADGKFSFSNVKPGEYRVVAGEKGVGIGGSHRFHLKAGHDKELTITIKPRQKHS